MNFPLNLDKNENQYGPAPKCYELLKHISMETFNSYSRDYPKRIKEKLANTFGVSPERIILGYGSEDILKQAIYYAVKSGDVLAVPDKSWWYYEHIGKEVGARVVKYDMIEKEDTFDYDVDKILEILKKDSAKALIICTPNNPTGNILDLERMQKIIEAAGDTMIILDEAYWGFTDFFYGEKMVEKYGNVIVLRTFSKYFSLAGVRIGFGFIGKDLSELQIYNNRYLGYNRISEELTFAALDDESSKYYEEKAKAIMEDAQMYYNEFKKLSFKPYKTNANFILAKLPEKEFNFLKQEMPKKGVIIKFFQEEGFKNCIRISIGTREQNNYVMKTIKKLLGR